MALLVDGPPDDLALVGVDRIQEPTVVGQILVAKARAAVLGDAGGGVLEGELAAHPDRVARHGAVGEVRRERVPAVVGDHGPADLAAAVADARGAPA